MRYILFFLVFFVAQVKAQSIADMLSPPFPTNLVAAPNGKAIAWVFNTKGERNIFYAAAPDYKTEQLTSYAGDEGIEISQLVFSTDGLYLFFVRGNASNNRGEAANPAQLQFSTARRLMMVDVHSKQLRMLASGVAPVPAPDGQRLALLSGGQPYLINFKDSATKEAKLFTVRGGVGQLKWSPDGNLLAFQNNRGDHSFVGLFDMAKNTVSFVETSTDHDAFPSWSPDGRYLAYIRIPNIKNELPFTPIRTAEPWSIRVYEVASATAREVFKAEEGYGSKFVDDLPASDNRLWWSKTSHLIFPWEKNGWMQLYAVDVQQKSIRHLTPGRGEVEGVQLNFSKTGLYFTSNIGDIDRRAISFLDFADWSVKKLTIGETISWGAMSVENGFALLQSSAVAPAWVGISLYGAQEKALARELFPSSFPIYLNKPTAIDIKAADGIVSHAELLLPPNYKPDKKYPAVIFLHGGSRRQMLMGFNYSQYYSNAYALQQFFALKGYIALTLNYRSGIGYGLKFREADKYGASGASEVKDVLAAARYLAARTDVDAKHIFPWGGSYGGYLTAHALSQAPGLFAAGVDIHGVHNWNTSIPVFADWYIPEKFPDTAMLALRSSPVYYAKNWKDPVLFIHGDDDRNVRFSETVDMIEQLRKQKVPLEQLVLPDEVHSFLLYKSWLKVYEATFDFIERHTKH